MERLSKLVEPTEAVYTMDGILRKQRHIDDLEDNSSLIEGETPVIKPKPRQRKKALAKISANVPKLTQPKAGARDRPAHRVSTGPPNIGRIPSPFTRTTYQLQSQYSPTEEENAEFQRAVRNLPLRKRAGNFTIFTDSATAYLPKMPSYPGQHIAVNNSHNFSVPQRLTAPDYDWLRPQNQNHNPLYLDTKYSYGPMYPELSQFQDMGIARENTMPATSNMENHTANPLTWRSPMSDEAAQSGSSDSTFGIFSGQFSATSNLTDPFGYAKNPLGDLFDHLEATINMDPAKSIETSTLLDGIFHEQTAVPAAGE